MNITISSCLNFSNGKNLCLRGGREHYNLKLSQFQFGYEEIEGNLRGYVVYTENGSKNRSGSYKDKTPNKVVRHYGEPQLKERCYIFILKKCFSVLPREVLEDPKSLFYQQPKEETPTVGVPWFKKQPRGRNTLQTMVKQICEKVGIQGKTNHSLRVTGASRMYECHVPEKLIKERTGHRSIDALRVYEHESLTQEQAVSLVVASTKYMDFKDVAAPMPKQQELAAFTQGPPTSDPPAPGPPAPTKGSEVVQPRDTAGPVAGWNIQSCSNCTINITLGN